MILGIPLYRLLILAALILVFGSVVSKIQWANVGKLGQAVSAQYPGGQDSPAPWFESTGARRARLKEEALAAGKATLADLCDADIVQKYRNTLIALARQRMRDMGCITDIVCNVEKGFKEVSFRLYASDADRRIARDFHAVMNAGAIRLGELGVYQFFIGHPKELAGLNAISMVPDRRCPASDQKVN